jgi:hypothetical protein
MGTSETLIEAGISNKGVRQDISGFAKLPQIDANGRYTDPSTSQSADKIDELYLNSFRLAVIPKFIVNDNSFVVPIISA